MEIKRTVLTFVFNGSNELLMIWKKRGQGKGKWNVPGGKSQAGEADEAAAIRETLEETGLLPSNLEKVGELEFFFAAGGSWSNTCAVFVARQFSGALCLETLECKAQWVPIAEIPWDQMWQSDRTWIPLVFAGKFFHRRYFFDAHDNLLREEIC